MINWNEVTVGETEIANTKGRKFLVVCIHEGDVWLYDTQAKYHFDRTIESLKDWTIYDPWEDVSDECRFDDEFCVYHGHHMLIEDDTITGRYKRDETGLRVWKRKEGVG